jgi:hypothetical protein
MLSNSEKPLEERKDLSNGRKTMNQCQVRVESMGEDSGLIGLIIPSWKNPLEVFSFSWDKFPVELMVNFKPSYRFHTEANLAAERVSDLYIDIDNYQL